MIQLTGIYSIIFMYKLREDVRILSLNQKALYSLQSAKCYFFAAHFTPFWLRNLIMISWKLCFESNVTRKGSFVLKPHYQFQVLLALTASFLCNSAALDLNHKEVGYRDFCCAFKIETIREISALSFEKKEEMYEQQFHVIGAKPIDCKLSVKLRMCSMQGK